MTEAEDAVRLPFEAKYAAVEMMKGVITKNPDGTVQYAEGWSDQRICDEIGFPKGLTAVTNIRRKKFGTVIARSGKAADNDALLDMIAELRRDLNALSRSVTRLALEASVDTNKLNIPKATE